MDVKQKIQEMVSKVTTDKALLELFQKEPVKAVEKVIGADLPDDVVQKIIDGVKAKIAVDKVGGAVDAIKKLF